MKEHNVWKIKKVLDKFEHFDKGGHRKNNPANGQLVCIYLDDEENEQGFMENHIFGKDGGFEMLIALKWIDQEELNNILKDKGEQ